MSYYSREPRDEGDRMQLLMHELGNSKILAGAVHGRNVLARLMQCTGREPGGPELVFLDFSSIDIATASFLRECVLAFRNTVRRRRSNLYPVIANSNDQVTDELEVLLMPHGDVMMLCVLDNEARVREPRIIGGLDPKQRITFDLVQEHGETDAADLMRWHGKSEGVGQTAWNNRLASLAGLGLVVELSQGRSKRYRPLFEEI